MAVTLFSSSAASNNPPIKEGFITQNDYAFDEVGMNHPYTSYSGADITATITVPGGETIVLGELLTLSYSIHRENTPVRLVGHSAPVAFVKGSRTIAGSMIFTAFNAYAFYRIKCMQDNFLTGNFPLADQLPEFDISLFFINEYGSMSSMKIMGVSIIDEGGTMSIDDLMTEQTYTYVARAIQPMVGVRTIASTDSGLANKVDISSESTRTGYVYLY